MRGMRLSRIGFGCGDNARLMVGDDRRLQERTVARALERGITYFDTAAKYGGGRSEQNLGAVLRALGTASADAVVGSKLLLDPGPAAISPAAVRAAVEGSLRRLGRDRIELYQLHDRVVTPSGGGWAPGGSRRLTPAEVLGPGGVAETLQRLRSEGVIGELGLTTFGGDPAAVAEIVASGVFASINSSVHLLNPTALHRPAADWPVLDYDGIAARAAEAGLAVLAIRVLGGGRLVAGGGSPAGRVRAADRDVRWDPAVGREVARAVAEHGPGTVRAALGWVLAWPQITTAICGLSTPEHVDAACDVAGDIEAGRPAWSPAEARAWATRLAGVPAQGG
jgi:aryl-alcohol dehydrogenase-like predicted oxidoreductase